MNALKHDDHAVRVKEKIINKLTQAMNLQQFYFLTFSTSQNITAVS